MTRDEILSGALKACSVLSEMKSAKLVKEDILKEARADLSVVPEAGSISYSPQTTAWHGRILRETGLTTGSGPPRWRAVAVEGGGRGQ